MSLKSSKLFKGDATNFFSNFLIGIVVGVILVFMINNYGYNDGKMICDNYVLNSYLYVVLAFVIMGITVLVNNKLNLVEKLGMIGFLLSFILSIVLIIVFKFVDKNDLFKLHLVWVLFFICLGYTLTITHMVYRNTNVLYTGYILTILVTIITGLFGYYYGQYIPKNIDNYLYGALILLIIVQLFGPLMVKDLDNFTYITAFVGLIIFILLLLSYHKKMRNNAEKCTNDNALPNYPNEAMGLVIKIVNVLQDILRLLNGRRRG
tara:strand:+ start:2526 stop:3314 length:789 start_codon:yes stop_codon:yes gene_type:complete